MLWFIFYVRNDVAVAFAAAFVVVVRKDMVEQSSSIHSMRHTYIHTRSTKSKYTRIVYIVW